MNKFVTSDIVGKGNLLITGGSGSFGSACIETCLRDNIFERVTVFSRDEYKHHTMRIKLIQKFGFNVVEDKVRFFIGDVRDKERLIMAFRGITHIVHAAALKHVNLCEYNPQEAIKTNIQGTQNVIEAAIENEVKKVICLSTDKSVDPINLYGSTKLCLEKMTINGNFLSKNVDRTLFSVVRYGNVIGSRGSVIPTLLEAHKEGKEFTLTDPDMTRFWLTIQDAVDLCFFGFAHMRGREIFVPILKSISMQDLIDCLAPGISLKVIGTRPGEKIHETMISEHELHRTYASDDYCYVMAPEMFGREEEKEFISALKRVTFSQYSSDSVERFSNQEFRDIVRMALDE